MPIAGAEPCGGGAVLIVSYNGRDLLADCLTSLFQSPDCPPARQIIVVDNASKDGSAEMVAQRFPCVRLLQLSANTGFTGGNNAGFELIRRELPHVRYVALLNQDTLVKANWLAEMVKLAERSPDVGAIQAKLLLVTLLTIPCGPVQSVM
jgi:GT2 family glycosyltransferase